jgi:hypothetical protein
MTETEQQAVELLKTLSPEARDRVFASVHDDSSKAFAPGYDKIVPRRIAEIESGKVECRPHSELISELRQELREKLANA